MIMDHLKLMALKVPRTAFCVSTSFSRTFTIAAQMLELVLSGSDRSSAGAGSVVVMWWDTQTRFQNHQKILKTKPLMVIFFAGEMGTAMAVNGSQVFYVEYCSHFKLNIKLSLEHGSVSQSEKNSSAFQCTI